MTQHSFSYDKRAQNISPERLDRLIQMANTLSRTPDQQKTAAFLSIMQEMHSQNLTFTQEEQNLLFDLLTENMNEKEKKQAMMIRKLSSQLKQKP